MPPPDIGTRDIPNSGRRASLLVRDARPSEATAGDVPWVVVNATVPVMRVDPDYLQYRSILSMWEYSSGGATRGDVGQWIDIQDTELNQVLRLLREHLVRRLSDNRHVERIEVGHNEEGWDLYIYIDEWNLVQVHAIASNMREVYEILGDELPTIRMDNHIWESREGFAASSASRHVLFAR